jgi:hypothetical protein
MHLYNPSQSRSEKAIGIMLMGQRHKIVAVDELLRLLREIFFRVI